MAGIWIAMPSPQTPTVGAGSSQREDSPARPHHAHTPCPRVDTIDGYGGGGARMRIWVRGVCSDVACRVAIKGAVSRLRTLRRD